MAPSCADAPRRRLERELRPADEVARGQRVARAGRVDDVDRDAPRAASRRRRAARSRRRRASARSTAAGAGPPSARSSSSFANTTSGGSSSSRVAQPLGPERLDRGRRRQVDAEPPALRAHRARPPSPPPRRSATRTGCSRRGAASRSRGTTRSRAPRRAGPARRRGRRSSCGRRPRRRARRRRRCGPRAPGRPPRRRAPRPRATRPRRPGRRRACRRTAPPPRAPPPTPRRSPPGRPRRRPSRPAARGPASRRPSSGTDDHVEEQVAERADAARGESYTGRMDDRDRDFRRLPSFLLGGAARRLRGHRDRAPAPPHRGAPRRHPPGLAAFEQAPCYREAVEREPASPSRDS